MEFRGRSMNYKIAATMFGLDRHRRISCERLYTQNALYVIHP
jgi:hypothetical protein